jgi:hypothetical protein
MMKSVMKRSLLMMALIVSVSSTAQAQDGGDKVVYKKRTLVDFSDVSIQGELRKPEGDFYGSRKRTRFGKLIRTRPNFTPEIISSTDNL